MLIIAFLACLPPVADTADSGDIADVGDTADTGEVGPATLDLQFTMDADLIEDMSEPPVGIFRGSIYAEADASALGPADRAVPLLDFVSDSIDLTVGGGPSPVAFSTDTLDAQIIWILGCLDADANECEKGDPITFPNDNKFAIVAGPNLIDVTMELLNPR